MTLPNLWPASTAADLSAIEKPRKGLFFCPNACLGKD
jgi:hypothetical protein